MINQDLIFPIISKKEKERKYEDMLEVLWNAKRKPEYRELEKTINNEIDRVIRAFKKQFQHKCEEIEIIYQHEKNPYTYVDDCRSELVPLISFTTISSRLDRVIKTVKSIKNQNYCVHSINLYISEDPYLLDEGISKNDKMLQKIHAEGVNVYLVNNIGPYRKQLPLIFQLKSVGASNQTPFITIDDDVIYPNNIIERLMTVLEGNQYVVAHRGRKIINNGSGFSDYKKFPPPNSYLDYKNIGTGKNGIVYRLGYFPKNIIDYLGINFAPTADDLWCKWTIGFNCIPTYILEPEAAYKPELDFEESEPNDKYGLYHRYNSNGTNDVATQRLELFFSNFRGVSLFDLLFNEDK